MTRVVRVAVIPGDGIGPEVVRVATEAVDIATRRVSDVRVEWEELPWGTDYYLEHGLMMPDDGLETLGGFDAIFLGAVGAPDVVPDHVTLWGLLIRIRRGLRQSLNVRPAMLLPGMQSPLRESRAFDLLVIRENSEGEYSQVGGTLHSASREMAMQVSVFTRESVESAMRFSFEEARRRRSYVVSATKSNGIFHTMPFWDRVFREVAADYPDVRTDSIHLDALLAHLVRKPEAFDVIVASNLFGDLLTDLTGALMGSIGMAPSVNLNVEGDRPSMFEPVHGSAPDIAGKGIANPLGQVWAAVMMLEHLGATGSAACLWNAMKETVEAGDVTLDMGGVLTTDLCGEALFRRIG